MYNDVFHGELAKAPAIVAAELRKNTEPPRTWSFMTPYLTAEIRNIDEVVTGVLAGPREHDVDAAVLMHYVKCKNPDDTVLTWAWAFQLLVDLKEATSATVNDVISEARLAIISAMPRSLIAPTVMGDGKQRSVAATMLAYAMGMTTPHSIDEAVDFCVMVQHLRATMGAQMSVTNLDKHWYADYADHEPQVHHFKVCDMPGRTEAIDVLRQYQSNTDPNNNQE